jgi:hypothetical protein
VQTPFLNSYDLVEGKAEGAMKKEMYKGIATQWATMLRQKGVPVAAARALGAYISGLEKRLAKLDKRITDLARSSHKHD